MSQATHQTKELKLYSPHEAQLAFHQSNARYRVAAWGRQSGKSTGCLNDLLKRAWERPGTRYWFISPTYGQSKTQYRRLVGSLSSCWEVLLKKNQSELRVKLVNQSEIVFKSGESFDNLRGESLDGVVIDEVRDQHPELWSAVVRPMLTTTGGWAAFISTPNGFDQFYDLAEMAKNDTSGQWFFMNAPSTANPKFTKEEFEKLRSEMSEDLFAQEILAEFRDLSKGRVYSNYSQENDRTVSPFANGNLVQPLLPVVLGCDFNVTPMSWTLSQKRANVWYFFDEIYLEDSNTQEAADEFVEKVLKLGIKAQPQVIICGDATGGARRTSAAGQTDYSILTETLRKAGITFENKTPDSNPLVKDRVNAVQAKLKDAQGVRHLFLHPINCKMLKKDFQRVCFKKGASLALDPGPDGMLTHPSDSAGYPIYALDPITTSGSVGSLRVIVRR